MRVWRFGRRPERRDGLLFAAALALGVVVIGCTEVSVPSKPGGEETAETNPGQLTGQVTRVVDGDTFHLTSTSSSIRVWGLDAPETGQPDGARATAALTNLIAGKKITCRQRDVDRYGRIVGQCFLPDGRDIAAQMISAGVAQEYCYFSGGYYGTCRGS